MEVAHVAPPLQGTAIPVRKAGFSATSLTPKKMAITTTFKRETAEKSTPDIEQVLRMAIHRKDPAAGPTLSKSAKS